LIASKTTVVFVVGIIAVIGLAYYAYVQNQDIINLPPPKNTKKVAVFFFYSPHCPHCEEVLPYVKELAKLKNITFCNVETMDPGTRCTQVAEDIGLSAVPTAVVYEKDKVQILIGTDDIRALGKILGVG